VDLDELGYESLCPVVMEVNQVLYPLLETAAMLFRHRRSG